jgi:exodeoxyribonuclease V alpha subunit
MGYIRGRIERVVHQSGSFFVFSIQVEETDFPIRDRVAKVSGHLCGLSRLRAGLTIQVMGDWILHKKWGRQLQPHGWLQWSMSTRDTERFLYECIDGFEDAELVHTIVTAFGEGTFDALQDIERVHALLKPDDGRHNVLDRALLNWAVCRTMADLSMFLQEYDLGPEVVQLIYEKFGHDVIDVISKNPYRLIAIDGFSFARADAIADRLSISRDDPRRVEGAVLWILRMEAQQGHLYIQRGDLPRLLNHLVESETVEPFNISDLYGALMDAVVRLDEQKGVVVDPNVGVYLPEWFLYERQSAEKLAKFLTPCEISVDLEAFLLDYQKSHQIDLSPAQQDAVRRLIENRVLVLTGLPGTGKTTVIRTFVRLFKMAGLSFSLMAPTGIAAKRLASVTGEEAATIHRTLKYNSKEWGYNGGAKLGIDAVIVDEMSMVDQELFYRILDALDPNTMLVFVGDDAQLPSVGPGNVLREMIACPDIPNIRLTQIFRQAETSDIVLASHKIHRGDTPLPEVRRPESEFQFVMLSDEEKMANLIVEMAAKLKGRDENFQVLSPKYDGIVGVNNLNERLRDRLNPSIGQPEWKLGPLHVRDGDRLMIVQNNYSLNVHNGDMGKLIGIEKNHLLVRVHGIGKEIDSIREIPKDSAVSMLKLAYAITVHKSQGSEFETIILPIVRSQGRMLQRNLFYTAVTRARKKVWLLGDSSAVLKAIANDKVIQRNTVFARALTAAHAAGVSRALHERRQEEPARAVGA